LIARQLARCKVQSDFLKDMPRFATVNDIVIVISMIVMLVVYGYDDLTAVASRRSHAADASASSGTQLTYLDYSFLRNSYWYFFGALGCVFLAYILTRFDAIENDWAVQNKDLLHFLVHVSKTTLSNLANVAILIAAIAYGRAENFKNARALKGLLISALLFVLWAVFWELVHHDDSLIFTVLLISPDVVIANVALILLGWVFLSRWSGVGVLFFLLMVIYAVLQLPARIALDLKEFLNPNKAVDLESTFYLLAVGKIFMVSGFVLMLRTVTDKTAEPRFWPRGPRVSPYPVSIQHVVLALLFALLVPLILHWANQAYAGEHLTFPSF
jgi:hypothetical protein